jgi:hypothetical protein
MALQHSPVNAEENHEKISEYPVFRLGFELGTSWSGTAPVHISSSMLCDVSRIIKDRLLVSCEGREQTCWSGVYFTSLWFSHLTLVTTLVLTKFLRFALSHWEVCEQAAIVMYRICAMSNET